MSLERRAWFSLAVMAVVMTLLLFVPAGTLRYRDGWVYLAIFFGTAAAATQYLLRHDRALLERRIRGGPTAERRGAQRVIMLFTSVGFAGLLVVPALGHRFHWSSPSLLVVLGGDVLVVVGFALVMRVYQENTFGSATVQVVENQRVVTTGPYAIVRHPMYASASLYLVGTPLALGSYWGLIPLAGMLPLLIWRLLDEEQLLARELPGYAEYQKTVRYRLVPGVW